MAKRTDLTGQQFGLLTITEFAGTIKGRTHYYARCSCGNDALAETSNLKRGKTTSCGCQRKGDNLLGEKFGHLLVTDFAGVIDGHRHWFSTCSCGRVTLHSTKDLKSNHFFSCGCAKRITRTPSSPLYPFYLKVLLKEPEARNIWKNFDDFLNDIGERPSPEHRLSKRDYRKKHAPDNTYWQLPNDESEQRRKLEIDDELSLNISSLFG